MLNPASLTKAGRVIMVMGFPGNCSLKTACNPGISELCVFKVRNTTLYTADNSHVYDCDNASFTSRLCCRLTEVCNDGVDNDMDTYIDCADSECYVTPTLCTGSPFNSSTCVTLVRDATPPIGPPVITNNSACIGPDSQMHYCSGYNSSAGICCGAGTHAVWDVMWGWQCSDRAECGLTLTNPTYPCAYDFDGSLSIAPNPWLLNQYSGVSNWCVSRLPSFYNPDNESFNRSSGCCLIVKDSKVDYFTDYGNVKIFGTT